MKHLYTFLILAVLFISTTSCGFQNQKDVESEIDSPTVESNLDSLAIAIENNNNKLAVEIYLDTLNIESQKDSVNSWYDLSKNTELKNEKRKYFLNKAYQVVLKLNDDPLWKNKKLTNISLQYDYLKDSLAFRTVNAQALALSTKLKDSIRLGYNYWDLANFYNDLKVIDSAYLNYFKAQKIYKATGNDKNLGMVILRMAGLQSDIEDNLGSEVTTIKALELFKPLKEYKQIYRCYNQLAIASNGLERYNKALAYHNKALEYLSKVDDKGTSKETTLNNIGIVYQRTNQHVKAIRSYNEALKTGSLKQKDTRLYAMLLDNLAYSKLKLKDTVGVNAMFQESLFLRNSIKHVEGKTVGLLHLAEYHAVKRDTVKVIQLANDAIDLAESSKNYIEWLKALRILSEFDKNNKDSYRQASLNIKDILLKTERATSDKFARIRFETNEQIEKNVLLTEEKDILTEEKEMLSEQNKIILITSLIVLLLGILIYIIRDQRVKNTRLRLEKEQQKANEEIYNLMLGQQSKLDEGKRNEKKRMSEELHDGILGNLYGIKMNLAVLNPQKNTDAILKREEYIEGLSNVIDEIRNVSHELSANALDANVGYVQLIKNLLIEQSTTYGYAYELLADKDTNWQTLPGERKMNIYRIIQESIQNINKYAKAKNVKVILMNNQGFIDLQIIDDGVGYNTVAKKEGIGIKNIKSRVLRLDGNVNISSKLNKGTVISIKIPCVFYKNNNNN